MPSVGRVAAARIEAGQNIVAHLAACLRGIDTSAPAALLVAARLTLRSFHARRTLVPVGESQ